MENHSGVDVGLGTFSIIHRTNSPRLLHVICLYFGGILEDFFLVLHLRIKLFVVL